MDTSPIKPNTLQQVRDAMEAVERACGKKSLSAGDRLNLQTASLHLRDMERSLMDSIQDKLVSDLSTDCDGLKALVEKIQQSSKKLDKLAGILETTCKAVDGFIKVISAALAAGLL